LRSPRKRLAEAYAIAPPLSFKQGAPRAEAAGLAAQPAKEELRDDDEPQSQCQDHK